MDNPAQVQNQPLIEPLPQAPPPPPAPQTIKKKFSILAFFGNFLFFIILFAVGVWVSTIVRPFFSQQQAFVPAPTVSDKPPRQETPQKPQKAESTWPVYTIEGILFRLPPDVLAPVCDGSSCSSKGTYLPGGSRFTVAARGESYGLGFTQGAVITDARGERFTTQTASVSGSPAVFYTGDFRGTTVGGYVFTKMRGVMIEVDEDLTVEFNHFAPASITVDFASDDTIFDRILKTIELPSQESSPSAATVTGP